jgi:hypothetical protein
MHVAGFLAAVAVTANKRGAGLSKLVDGFHLLDLRRAAEDDAAAATARNLGGGSQQNGESDGSAPQAAGKLRRN